jgi:hypothetical protein
MILRAMDQFLCQADSIGNSHDPFRDFRAYFQFSYSRYVQGAREKHGTSQFTYKIVSGEPCDSLKKTEKLRPFAQATIQVGINFSFKKETQPLEHHEER